MASAVKARCSDRGELIEGDRNPASPCDCDHDHPEHPCKGNNGFGNGGHDGVPGNPGKQDCTR